MIQLTISEGDHVEHPVVSFKDYMQVFGGKLKQMDFITFNENLKFRVSQRMVCSVKDLSTEITLENSQHKSVEVCSNNLLVHVLDQSTNVDEAYNPVSLVPGIQVKNGPTRPMIHLFNGFEASGFLESLGFVQILNSD